jgi:monofunctional biosynthetic peptidoglycan transglycosylase
MPWRPASLAARADAPGRRSFAAASGVRRVVVIGLLIVLLVPPALLMVYRFLPVPITPLMVIRLVEGEGLHKAWVPLEAIAPALPRAVVAAEDNRFCQHFGFDWQELEGQIDALLAGERARGASTITMQTAKNLFLWPGRDPVRKVLEAWLTPQVELLLSKRRILEVYLNVAEFGPGIYGAEAAARAYFAKPASALSAREAALLAAILPSPRNWSPVRATEYIRGRERTIRTRIDQLGAMLDCIRPA